MSGTLLILKKEWRCFVGSDRGIFLLYMVLILSWSFMLASPSDGAVSAGPFWLVFFSVVISANFANTVFISERVNGILEILLTSGLSRRSILYGKMIFVAGMSIAIGIVCIALSQLWRVLIYEALGASVSAYDLLLYAAAVFMSTASSAYLSVRMANPRLLHIANLFLLALIITLYTVCTQFWVIPPTAPALVLIIIGAGATYAAQCIYESEKILQPVVL